MPTVSEAIDQVLQLAIQAATYACYCKGHGCPPCGATGRTSLPPPADDSEDGWATWHASGETIACRQCGGNGVCPECTGGVCIAGPYDPYVASMALVAVVGLIQTSRDKNNFDSMNQAIDWGHEYTIAMAADEARRGATIEGALELVRAGGEMVASVTPDEPPLAGALTPKEIADLTGDDS